MSNKDLYIRSSSAEFLIFKLQEKEDGIQVRYENENLWLTQKSMSEQFDCSTDNIGLHLKVKNWIKIQLPRNSRQLLQMAKTIIQIFII